LFLLAMLNGVVIGKSRLGRPLLSSNEPLRFNRYYLDVLALATIAAYLIWFRGVFFSSFELLNLLTSGLGVNRLEHQTIGGVTTATQFGLAFLILYLTTIWSAPNGRLPARFNLYLLAILFLTLFRVFAWGERVALAEIMIPIFLLYVRFRINGERRIVRVGLSLLPLLAVLALLGYFAITEYFRSWATHYQFQQMSVSTPDRGKRFICAGQQGLPIRGVSEPVCGSGVQQSVGHLHRISGCRGCRSTVRGCGHRGVVRSAV
jgi:hypothetical protein